jgi:SAM-dependent methyltransferase
MSYDKKFYEGIHNYSDSSAKVIVPLILEVIDCNRVIDIGCGDGTWLKNFQEKGVKEILGVDGDYVDANTLLIPHEHFIPWNLQYPLEIHQRFDLAISLEVAEHLPEECANIFVDSLVNLSSTILFSAAIPHQGGEHHVNEQWQDYWAEKFQCRGYIAIDYIRPHIWNNPKVAYWYRQNILIFVKLDELRNDWQLYNKLAPYTVKILTSLSVVHPVFFLLKTGAINWQDIGNIDLSAAFYKKRKESFLSRLKRKINILK